MLKLYIHNKMWMIAALVALAAVVFYAYTVQGSIKIAPPKAGCNSCPHAQKEKYD